MNSNALDLNARIRTVIDGRITKSTAGRLILKSIIPDYVPEKYWNKVLKKKDIGVLVDYIYKIGGVSETAGFLDNLKDMGFKYATKVGVSISIDDIKIPEMKVGTCYFCKRECERDPKTIWGRSFNGSRAL